jgi:hypothetical protein
VYTAVRQHAALKALFASCSDSIPGLRLSVREYNDHEDLRVCLSAPVPEIKELHLQMQLATADLVPIVGGGFVAGQGTRYLFDRFPCVEHLFLDVQSTQGISEEEYDFALDEMLGGFKWLRNVTFRYISMTRIERDPRYPLPTYLGRPVYPIPFTRTYYFTPTEKCDTHTMPPWIASRVRVAPHMFSQVFVSEVEDHGLPQGSA